MKTNKFIRAFLYTLIVLLSGILLGWILTIYTQKIYPSKINNSTYEVVTIGGLVFTYEL